jgi:O-antigen ligase
MSNKIAHKVFIFWNTIYFRVGFMVLSILAAFFSGYLVSVLGSIVLKFAAALLLGILIFRFPFAGLLAFVGMIPLESAFFSIGSGAVTYTRLLGVYLFILWFAKMVIQRRRMVVMPYTKWLLPFLVWASASILWASDRQASVQSLFTLIQMFALGLVVYNEANDRKRLNAMLLVLVAGSTLAVILGYFQVGTLTGKDLLTLQSQGVKEYGSIVGLAFLSGFILYFFGDKNRRRPLPLIISAISIYPLLAASERGVYLAIMIALFSLGFISQRKLDYVTYAVLAVLAFYGVFLLIARFGGLSSFAISRFSITNIIETGGTGRTDIWKVGWRMVQDHPLIGVGLGNFPAVFNKYTPYTVFDPSLAGSGPHNDLLSVAAETGVIGLILFIGLLGSLGVRLLQLFRKPLDPELVVLSAWVMGLFVYSLSDGLTSVFIYRKFYWLIIVLVEVAIKVAQDASGDIGSVLPKRERRSRFRKKREVVG